MLKGHILGKGDLANSHEPGAVYTWSSVKLPTIFSLSHFGPLKKQKSFNFFSLLHFPTKYIWPFKKYPPKCRPVGLHFGEPCEVWILGPLRSAFFYPSGTSTRLKKPQSGGWRCGPFFFDFDLVGKCEGMLYTCKKYFETKGLSSADVHTSELEVELPDIWKK